MIPYAPILSYAALAAACAWAGWTAQGWRLNERIAALQTQYATAQFNALEKAHAETIRLQEQADAAARKHAARSAALAHDARRSDTALGLLHDAANAAIAAAKDSHSACESNAATLAVVSTQCGDALNTMARDAQGWFNESVMLRDAWPTSADPQRQ